MPNAHGEFIWYELMTPEPDKAESFYRSVFGWDVRDSGQPATRYSLLSTAGTDVGGVLEMPADACAAGARPGWVAYVGVEDVDAATASVAADGGAVHVPPRDIPGVGRFSVVADPQGAMFNLMTGASKHVSEAFKPMSPGHFGWNELYSTDWKAGYDFYTKQFGWDKADAIDMGPMGTYQLFSTGTEPVGGMMNNPAEPCSTWLFYVNVDDIDAAADRVTSSGGPIVMGPYEVPGGSWIIQARDPQGAMFAAVGPRLHKGE